MLVPRPGGQAVSLWEPCVLQRGFWYRRLAVAGRGRWRQDITSKDPNRFRARFRGRNRNCWPRTFAPRFVRSGDTATESDSDSRTQTMETNQHHEPALDPQDSNGGDVEGLVALYEPDAILATAGGQVAKGSEEIRRFYSSVLMERSTFTPGEQRPALRNGGIALTSTRLVNGVITAEIARQQYDGTWLWVVDQPNIAP